MNSASRMSVSQPDFVRGIRDVFRTVFFTVGFPTGSLLCPPPDFRSIRMMEVPVGNLNHSLEIPAEARVLSTAGRPAPGSEVQRSQPALKMRNPR